MTLRVYVKAKLCCPKHTRYDPAMEGEGGIKGGCANCRELLQVHLGAQDLVEHISRTQEQLKAARA